MPFTIEQIQTFTWLIPLPPLLSFVLIGFFVWLAENNSTFFNFWQYPNQVGAWAVLHVGK